MFRFLILAFCCIYLPVNAELGQQTDPESGEKNQRQEIIKEAEKYLGKRYKTNIKGQVMDCSGYTRFILSKFGIKVTRSSVTQVKDGTRVIEMKDAKPGDILVFKGRNPHNNIPGHVGLVHHWSNDTLYFIHSSVQKGITIDHMYDPYYKRRYLQTRNVLTGKK